ncbi:212_t:CDS:2, partial [Gigaspora rosea]
YGEPFSLYIFGTVVTFTGSETSTEVLKNSAIFDFHSAVDKIFPISSVFRIFNKKFHSLEFTARVVHEEISSKLNLYFSRIQKEILFGIEKYFGKCE